MAGLVEATREHRAPGTGEALDKVAKDFREHQPVLISRSPCEVERDREELGMNTSGWCIVKGLGLYAVR